MLNAMRLKKEAPSWQISVGDRETLTVALWLRDASGMAPDLDPPIPPLEPAVPVRDDLAALAVPQAVAQWTGMWIGLWEGRLDDWFALHMLAPPGFELLSHSPHLKALTSLGWEPAGQWSARHRPFRDESPTHPAPAERLPKQMVELLEKENGRPANLFEFGVRILPVAGRHFWLPTPNELVVTENLARDMRAFRDVLRDVLGPIV
jgi:hypothetical protein